LTEDHHHALVDIPELVAYVLLLNSLFKPKPNISPWMTNLSTTPSFQNLVGQFRSDNSSPLPHLTVGMTIFTDGYDPNCLSSGNRASVWVAIGTLVIYDHSTHSTVATCSSPLASATGNVRHDILFQHLSKIFSDWDGVKQASTK
jgi:hypothetical protein